jgi:hypothetical protein
VAYWLEWLPRPTEAAAGRACCNNHRHYSLTSTSLPGSYALASSWVLLRSLSGEPASEEVVAGAARVQRKRGSVTAGASASLVISAQLGVHGGALLSTVPSLLPGKVEPRTQPLYRRKVRLALAAVMFARHSYVSSDVPISIAVRFA